MNQIQDAPINGSTPTPMALIPNPITSTIATPGVKKDLDYYRQAFEKVNLQFYRATRLVADLVLDARLNLSPEEFHHFMENEVQFDYSTIRKLINTASSFTLNDPKNQVHLPDAWTLRYEIMLMAESTFRIGVTTGIIHKNCNLDDLKRLREQIEGKKKTSKKAAPKKAASSSRSAAETPQEASIPAETSNPPESEPEAPERTEAAVKATVNTSGLRVVEKPATSTAAATVPVSAQEQGRIKIVVSREVADEHQQDVDSLKMGIDKLIMMYPFIVAVDIEVAA